MMTNPLLSVIIPVYNVEEYLDRCLESVVNQTYKNLEIILVDDGSPDNCPQMCDEWSKKDNRIKVVHKSNGGLSDARNCGINISSGDFLYFLDSDDTIEINALEILYNAAAINNCEIAVGMHTNIVDGKIQEYNYSGKTVLYSSDEYIASYYQDCFDFDEMMIASKIISCNKLVKAALFDDLRFPLGVLHEDEYTTLKLIFKSEKIAFVQKPLYNYYRRTESITGKTKTVENLKVINAFKDNVQMFYENRNERLYNLSLIHLLISFIDFYFVSKYYIKDLAFSDNIRTDYHKYYKLIKKTSAVELEEYKKRRLLFQSFNTNEYLYRFIRKITK